MISQELKLEKVKVKAEKLKKLLPNIPMDNITEVRKLIYAGVKLACDKIGVLLSNLNRNTKPGMGN